MTKKALTLEEFRKYLEDKYLAKGVLPPKPNSEKEKVLYNLYLKSLTQPNNE